MSVWKILRTKQLWIAVGVTAAVLLLMWGGGALLIEKGTVPPKMESGWIAVSCILSGALGGCMISRGKQRGLMPAIILSGVLLGAGILLSWILFGEVSFANGAWKNMLCFLSGSMIAGTMCAGRPRRTKKNAMKRIKSNPYHRR